MLQVAVEAAELLGEVGIKAQALLMQGVLKPLDKDT